MGGNFDMASLKQFADYKIFYAVMIALSTVVGLDVFLWNVYIIPDISLPNWLIIPFVAFTAIFVVCQYPLLAFIKNKNKQRSSKIVHNMITILQFILIAIVVLIALQIMLTTKYLTITLSFNSTI